MDLISSTILIETNESNFGHTKMIWEWKDNQTKLTEDKGTVDFYDGYTGNVIDKYKIISDAYKERKIISLWL